MNIVFITDPTTFKLPINADPATARVEMSYADYEALKKGAEVNVAVEMDLVAFVRRQREWSQETYGPGQRTEGVIKHIKKELKEIGEHPLDLKEWIDVVILALDGAWRAGHEPEDIAAALSQKQIENIGRKWPDWRTHPEGEPIEHIRDVPIYQDPRYQEEHRFDEPINRDKPRHLRTSLMEEEVHPGSPHLPRKDLGPKDVT